MDFDYIKKKKKKGEKKMEKKVLGIIAVILLLLSLPQKCWGDSMNFATDWTTDVQVVGGNLWFSSTATVQPLWNGLYGIKMPWEINNTADVVIIIPLGATYFVALDSLTIADLWVLPGESFSFSYQVSKDWYEPIGGTVTSYGYIPGPNFLDDQDQDQIWVPSPLGGPGVIPEPTTWLLLGTGIIGLACRIVRKK
ncbi:MAG: PEP-CTERM sorting domain-containing protein [Candidatus Kuenenbacteria bacterium]